MGGYLSIHTADLPSKSGEEKFLFMPTLQGRQGNRAIPVAILLGCVLVGGAIALSFLAFSKESSQTPIPTFTDSATPEESLPTDDDLDSVDTLNP